MQRALTINKFCSLYGIGRTTAYEEMKKDRLKAVKVGAKTLIRVDDAEAWLKTLSGNAVEG
jgi:excisionase family DNA binding protein